MTAFALPHTVFINIGIRRHMTAYALPHTVLNDKTQHHQKNTFTRKTHTLLLEVFNNKAVSFIIIFP